MGVSADLYAHLPANHIARRSSPTLTGFSPDVIPYQRAVVQLVRSDHDYRDGTLEILLSGSIGSAKSVLLAHLAVTHCLMHARARVGIARRALPDLKGTLLKEIIEHIQAPAEGGDQPALVEGKDYKVNTSRGAIKFRNGSEIVPIYWADRKYKRVRSLKLSMLVIEEMTENDERDQEGFIEAKSRVGRLPHVPENIVIGASNPDSPAHWVARYFISPKGGKEAHPNRHVFYSRTFDNPYLAPIYISGLRRDMDAKRARRMLDGEWIELDTDRVYYCYDADLNYVQGKYKVNRQEPVYLTWDFNIGLGKPLSAIAFQYVGDVFHFFAEVVVEGIRTGQSCDELADKGVLDLPVPNFYVCGDASGRSRDTRNKKSDYTIIMDFLGNYKTKDGRSLVVENLVPLANPPVRSRHNTVNTYCHNSLGERRLYIYKACDVAHEGMRLVQLRKGADYVEDDTPAYQHVTTAIGYGVMSAAVKAAATPTTSGRF